MAKDRSSLRREPASRSAGYEAVELIRKAILTGKLQPGERLREEALARDLQLSRTPVREALRILQTEGLIETVPYSGSTVRVHETADLDDMYALRGVLEGHAARLAALRVRPEEIELLEGSCARFEALGDATEENVHQLVEENQLFHTIVLEAARSPRLLEMVRTVIELPLIYKSYIWYSAEQKRISEHAHRQLTHALAAHDADRAEIVMKLHLLEARDLLIARMREERGDVGDVIDGSLR